MLKQPPEGFFKKDVMRNFEELTRSHMYQNLFLWCFLGKFPKFVRTPVLQSSKGRLLLITAVSIEAKGLLAIETISYDIETKAYTA